MNIKTIRTILLTLIVLAFSSTGVKVINAQNISDEVQNTVSIEFHTMNDTCAIDPDSEK